MYKISIIIPALNEQSNINKAVDNVIQSLRTSEINGEIIIIDDGSIDNTGLIAKEYESKYSFVKLIQHKETKGISASYWDGVKYSSAEIVTWIPGDAENDCQEILRYINLMNEVDIVIPFIYNDKVRTWKRRIPSIIYKLIINLSFGTFLNYINGGVMYRKCIIENIELKSKGFFFQTELLMKCLKKDYFYAEVPLTIRKRKFGGSKAFTLRSFINIIYSFFSILFEIHFNKMDRTIVDKSVTAERLLKMRSH